jgi:uncharacterized protein YbgA (DUF1722 family)/uncharacterized protein YbbK (DUF523 family)
MLTDTPIRLGVSACLLGRAVRYDGGHKRDRWIAGELGKYVEFVPVCPEMEAGMGVPREAMRLVGDPAAPRLVTIKSGLDLTGAMLEWAARRVEELAGEDLCGFIFKRGSPSSGMARVKVYPESGGSPAMTGAGLFARAFMERFPLLPVEEEGRLGDARLRENFIERLFALRAWRELAARLKSSPRDTRRDLPAFHARMKLQLMAHEQEAARAMGRLVANVAEAGKTAGAPDAAPAAGSGTAALLSQYEALLLKTLAKPATVARNVNVLDHMAGYFRKLITDDERLELREAVEDYRRGFTPLIAPVTLFKHHVRKHGVAYLAGQSYLNPHPLELKLRNYY